MRCMRSTAAVALPQTSPAPANPAGWLHSGGADFFVLLGDDVELLSPVSRALPPADPLAFRLHAPLPLQRSPPVPFPGHMPELI